MDSSSHSWLAFSLSNHSSLFPSFSSPPPPSPLPPPGTTVDASPEAAAVGVGATTKGFSVFAGGGPKFEDFLGGGSSSATSVTAAVPTPPALHQFSTHDVFGSELKTIAAGLAAAEPRKQALALAVPSSKKTADTFGQRTSIYRGVTR